MNVTRKNTTLRKASIEDKETVVGFDFRLDEDEHIKLNRSEKITKAILDEECFIVLADEEEVGFLIFNYQFFGNGWIELLILDEAYRGKGLAGKILDLLCQHCKSDKIFTSTNRSNIQMQKALTKAKFSFAGELIGLDEGDPEYFYFKVLNKNTTSKNGT